MDEHYEVGRGKPPVHSRFKKGQSGNPKGRPRRPRFRRPYEVILDQIVTLVEQGVSRKVRAEEAFLAKMSQLSDQGHAAVSQQLLAVLDRQETRTAGNKPQPTVTYKVYSKAGQIDCGMRALGMATLLDPYRPSAYLRLEPWIVQHALNALGTRRFTPAEQALIVEATRYPAKVRWPDWWEQALLA